METYACFMPIAADLERTTFDEEFIAQFGQLSELWNARHKDYSNKTRRQQGYDKLLSVFKRYKPHAAVDDVRKKINSLRSNYRRELRRIAEAQKIGDVYTPRSKSFKLLSFLYDTEMPDCNEQINTSEVVVKYEEPEETETGLYPASPINETISHYTTMISPPQDKSDASQPGFLPTTPHSSIYQHSFKESMALSQAYIWSKKLEKLEPMQRLFAEKAINDVLFEAQLGNLHRHSVKINDCDKDSNTDRQGGI